MKLAVVLCSAQSKKPTGGDAWVAATLAAVDQLVRDGHTLIASIGLNTWELALWRAVRRRARVHVMLVPRRGRIDTPDDIAREFGIPRGTAAWESIEGRGKAAWQLRDARAVERADLIAPVCLREGGKLDRLLRSAVPAHKVTQAFAIPYVRYPRSAAWEKRHPTGPSPIGAEMLVHLTRSAHGPWPGESPRHYYAALACSRGRDPRDGLATLRRIVQEGRVRGTPFRSNGGVPRVCLTARPRDTVLELVRFRARYARYAFEPYGIAIDRSAAIRCGARPVVYGAEGGEDARFVQGPGVAGHWEAEREWRIVGDLDLRSLAPSEVVVLTATAWEASQLRRTCSFPVSAFGYDASDTERAIRSSNGS